MDPEPSPSPEPIGPSLAVGQTRRGGQGVGPRGVSNSSRRPDSVRDVVAIILAIGLCTALNLLMFAVLWDALRSDSPGISENATQIMIAVFGGIIGLLGAYVGARGAERGYQARKSEVIEEDTNDR